MRSKWAIILRGSVWSKYDEKEDYAKEPEALVYHSCDPRCTAFDIEGNAEFVGTDYQGDYEMTLYVDDQNDHKFMARSNTFLNTDVEITVNALDGVVSRDFYLRIPKDDLKKKN
jgi:hypothetical protein